MLEMLAALVTGAALLWLWQDSRNHKKMTAPTVVGVDTRSFGGVCVYTHPVVDDVLVVEADGRQYCLSAYIAAGQSVALRGHTRLIRPTADEQGVVHAHTATGSKVPVGWERNRPQARRAYLKEVREWM